MASNFFTQEIRIGSLAVPLYVLIIIAVIMYIVLFGGMQRNTSARN